MFFAALCCCRKAEEQGARGTSAATDTLTYKPVAIERLDRQAALLLADSAVELSPEFCVCHSMVANSQADPKEFAAQRTIAAFLRDVERAFANTDTLAMQLGRVLRIIDGNTDRRVVTVVLPYMQSVVTTGDSAVYIVLNHYLGSDHPAYAGFADYVRDAKEPGRIAPDVAEALMASSHPYAGEFEDATLLSHLLYNGALIEGMMQATGISEQEALGYDDAQMKWLADNQTKIWDEILKRKLLFTVNPSVAERMINPAPHTSILNPESPGRLGRWLGHRIVSAYLKNHPSTTLSHLLDPKFYLGKQTLAESGYQGK